MLRKKLKVTRIVAIISALLMLLTMFDVPLLPNVNLNVSAATGTNSSPGGPGSKAVGEYTLFDGNIGYRIYFAKSQLSQDGIGVSINDAGANVPGIELGKTVGLDKVHEYLGDANGSFALYHMWGKYTNNVKYAYLADGTEMYVADINGKDNREQQIATKSGDGNLDIFQQLGKPEPLQGFGSAFKEATFDADGAAFNAWINGADFDIDAFIAKYKNILGEGFYSAAGLPDSGNEFNGEWAIIIEPLLLSKYGGDSQDKTYCVGFYDFFAPSMYSYSDKGEDTLKIETYVKGEYSMQEEWSNGGYGLRWNPLAKANLPKNGTLWFKRLGTNFWGYPIESIDNPQYNAKDTIYAGWSYYTANGQAGSKSKANVSITHKQTATGSEEMGRSVTFWRNGEEAEIIEPLKSAVKGFADASVAYTDENTNIDLNVVRSSANGVKDYNSGRDLEIGLVDLPETMAGVSETDGTISGTDGYTLSETYYVQARIDDETKLNAEKIYENLEDMNVTQFTSSAQIIKRPPDSDYFRGSTYTTIAEKGYQKVDGNLKYELEKAFTDVTDDTEASVINFSGLKVVEGAALNKTRSHYTEPEIINNIVTNGATYGLTSSGMQDISIPELSADGAGTFGFEFNLLTEKTPVESGVVFVKLHYKDGEYVDGWLETKDGKQGEKAGGTRRVVEKTYDISETWQTTSEKSEQHTIYIIPNNEVNANLHWRTGSEEQIVLEARSKWGSLKYEDSPQPIYLGTGLNEDKEYTGFTVIVTTRIDEGSNLDKASLHLKEYELGHFYPDLNKVAAEATANGLATYKKVNASGYNWDNGGNTLVTDKESFAQYSSGIDWLERQLNSQGKWARNLFGASDGYFITNTGGHSASRWNTELGANTQVVFNIKANLTRGALKDMFNLSTLEYGGNIPFENLGLLNALTGSGTHNGDFGESKITKNSQDSFLFTTEKTWHKLSVNEDAVFAGNEYTENKKTVEVIVPEETAKALESNPAFVKRSEKPETNAAKNDPYADTDSQRDFYRVTLLNNSLNQVAHNDPYTAEYTGYYDHRVVWAVNSRQATYAYSPAKEAVTISLEEVKGKDKIFGVNPKTGICDDIEVEVRKKGTPYTVVAWDEEGNEINEPITSDLRDEWKTYDYEADARGEYADYDKVYYTQRPEPARWVANGSEPISAIQYVECYHYNTQYYSKAAGKYVWATKAETEPYGYETVTESSERYFANERGIGTSSENSSLLEEERNIGTWGYGSLWYRNYTDRDTAEGLFTTKAGVEITDADKKYLTFWPEVVMIASNNVDSNGVSNSWLPGPTGRVNGDGRNNPDPYASYYVMGDVARKVAPSALYSIRLMDTAAKEQARDKDLTGKFSSSTIANQKVASVTGNEKDLPVVYAGGDINAKIEQNYTVVLNGFVLDLDNQKDPKKGDGIYDLKETWNNDTIFNTAKDFEQWSEQIAEGFTYDVGLDVVKNNSEKTVEYVELQAQTGKSTIKELAKDTKIKYVVKIKNGEAVWDSETEPLLRRLRVVYGCTEDEAKELIKKSGMLEALAKSVESSIDGDNESAKDDGLGLGNGEHWYDEQVRSFVIKEYETVIAMPEILVNDKIDYGAAPKQNGALFSNGYRVDWKLSVTLSSEALFNVYNTKLLVDKTVGKASFIVADATTSDMRR